jgi:hypothetical protein
MKSSRNPSQRNRELFGKARDLLYTYPQSTPSGQANSTLTSPPAASFLRNKLPPLPKYDTKPLASTQIPMERNNARLQVAKEGDHSTMSKYLPSSLTSFLMAPVVQFDGRDPEGHNNLGTGA